jgi:hypothetical protein
MDIFGVIQPAFEQYQAESPQPEKKGNETPRRRDSGVSFR